MGYPRTVCVSDRCTEMKKDDDGNNQIFYKTHCHTKCYLTNVVENVYPNVHLQGCWAMQQNNGRIECHVNYFYLTSN